MSLQTFVIEENIEKKELEINEYSTVSIKLPGNPSTGFGWYLENKEDLLKSNIKPLNLNEFLTVELSNQEGDNKLLGQGGFFDFKFKFLPGAENKEAKFVYKRFNVTENSKPLSINFNIKELKIEKIKQFKVNETEGELEIKEGELTSIQITGNATTGHLWFLDNIDELNKAGINIINLGEHNTGKYLIQKPKEGEPMLVGAPGIFEFVIKADKLENELPKIKFVNKRMNDKEGKILLITLKKNEVNNIKKIRFNMKGGKNELEVENNTIFNIELEGNPTTGYSWVLENPEIIKESKVLKALNLDEEHNTSKDYIQDPCEDGMCGVGGTYVYTFEIKDAKEEKDLPCIIFGYKRPWEKDVKEYNKAEVCLKLKKCDEKQPFVSLKKEGGIAELKVEDNQIFKIALEGNPTTGYSWYMKNSEEIKNSGLIEILNLDEHLSAEYLKEGNLLGQGGVFCFKFKVNNKEKKEMPKLLFEYKRPWEKEKEPIGKAEITLKF